MWELDHQEGWALKTLSNYGAGEDSLQSPVDYKEIKSVIPKGNQPWIFTGRTDAEALIVWPPDAKSWLIGKDPDAGKDWRWEEKGTTEDEMVGWHHQLNGHEFEQTLGDSGGHRSLVCCSPWGRKELDMTQWLNWTELIWWYPCVEFPLVFLENGVCYEQVCSLDKTVSFCCACFILYSKVKLACYSRYLLTSYFCIPVHYDEKDIFLWC